MAIDSADKRKSAVNWLRRILPIPDNVINAADRVHVAGFFRGIIRSVEHNIGSTVDLLLKKLGIDISIDSDLLLKKLDITVVFSSDLLLKKLDIIKTFSSNLLLKKLDIIKTFSSNLLLKKLDIIKTFSSDLLLKKLDITKIFGSDLILKKFDIINITSDLLIYLQYTNTLLCNILIKKLDTVISSTIDIIISSDEQVEYLNLKSYINVLESDDSIITTTISDDSEVLKAISKFSETDSNIVISRYSIMNLEKT